MLNFTIGQSLEKEKVESISSHLLNNVLCARCFTYVIDLIKHDNASILHLLIWSESKDKQLKSAEPEFETNFV